MFSSNTSQVVAAAAQPEAIDYDGTEDYLSRSSDLVGNADGKTFTFSAWVWWDDTVSLDTIYTNSNLSFIVSSSNGSEFYVTATNSSGGEILYFASTTDGFPKDTFVNIIISVDLTSSSNRFVYVNDAQISGSWLTYTNDTIDFTATQHAVAARTTAANYFKGRLSNVFLDYTYRDMSITANRRLFVTADLKPAAGQAALNPIMYLTMADPTQPGKNSGTGGDFTLTGTVARSGRGPNQYNAPYSDLDGSADYLNRASTLTGLADSQVFTMSFVFNNDTIGSDQYVFVGRLAPYNKFLVSVYGGGLISVTGITSAIGVAIDFTARLPYSATLANNRNYVVTISVDLTSSSKRHVYINGEAATVTWGTYSVGSTINFTGLNVFSIGADYAGGGSFFNGRLGALWFNTSYIDLSVASNLAKFVTGTGINAAPADLGGSGEGPTGTSPLIYLPMFGNNAGKNYGTGGDFTVNSGPYTGARGPNEFWGNKANFDGTTGYLSRTSALSGISNTKQLSLSCFYSISSWGIASQFYLFASSIADATNDRVRIYVDSGGTLYGYFTNASGVLFAVFQTATALPTGTHNLMLSIDFNQSSALNKVYVDGVNYSVTWLLYANDTIDYSGAYNKIGRYGAIYYRQNLAELYIANTYIDFSQEANRLKFRDCFGNPTNLPSAITALSVPNPAIYMRFDPASFGTNSGTGGNFTVNGTITDGGQL